MNAAPGSTSPPPDAGDTLVGVLAHELRTPITTLYAGSILLARHTDLPPTMRRALAANIREEAARVYRVVEDLLVLARLEHGGLHAAQERVVPGRVMRTAVQLESGRWPWLKIQTSVSGAVRPVAADPHMLAHVFRNLIATVGTRSTPGALVMVAEMRAGRVACRVVDRTGSVPAVGIERIFELPQHAGEGLAVGPGVAMFVVRELVLAMGGTVWARIQDDGCAELGFDLPAYEAA